MATMVEKPKGGLEDVVATSSAICSRSWLRRGRCRKQYSG
jgi:hypothetical protein